MWENLIGPEDQVMCAGDILSPPSWIFNSFEPIVELEFIKNDGKIFGRLFHLEKVLSTKFEAFSTVTIFLQNENDQNSSAHIGDSSSHQVNKLKAAHYHQSHCSKGLDVKEQESCFYSLKNNYVLYPKKATKEYAEKTLFKTLLTKYNKKLAHMPSFRKKRKAIKVSNKRSNSNSSKRKNKHESSFKRANQIFSLDRSHSWKMNKKSYIRNSKRKQKVNFLKKKAAILYSNKKGLHNHERVFTSILKRFKKSRKGYKERFKIKFYNIHQLDSEQDFDSSPEQKGRGFSFSRSSTLQSRNRSSPDTFKNVTRPPVLDSEFNNSSLQKGAIPKIALASEEVLNKETNERNSRDSCKRSSLDTIKLIDKVLENSSNCSFKTDKTRVPLLKERARSKSLCITYPEIISDAALNKTFLQSSNKGACNVQTRHPNVKRHKSLDKFSLSILHDNITVVKKSSSFNNLNGPEDKELKKEIFLTPNDTSHIFGSNVLKCTQGVTASFESINTTKTHKSPLKKDKRQMSDLLHRLDNVLSELVEEEKLKIQTYKISEASQEKTYCKSFASQKLKIKKKSKDKKLSTVNIHPLYLSPQDALSRYKEKFTEFKPKNPRILKCDSKSKLLTMSCYQRPRPKKSVSVANKKRDDLFVTIDKEKNKQKESKSNYRDSRVNIHKNSFDEEWSYPSFTSAESDRDIFNNKNSSLFDDEDDTCYGSDNVNSDLIIEKSGTAIERSLNFRQISKNVGDCSVDSAYTESREATPDIKINDVSSILLSEVNHCYKPKRHKEELSNSTSTVQVINDAKKYLIDKIRDTQSYSDNNINKILHYYSKKWTHIPEREMKIIVRSIRSDLGVRAPPKECIEFLMEENFQARMKGNSFHDLTDNSSLSLSLQKELSKEDILLDLTETLPEYLKVYKDKRKSSSLSSSPEPCKFNFSKELSESMTTRFSERSPEPLNMTDDFNNYSPTSDLKIICVPPPPPPAEICETERQTDEESDEDWVKKVVGEETFREMKTIINELKEKGKSSETASDPKEFEKMASELCEKFSISF